MIVAGSLLTLVAFTEVPSADLLRTLPPPSLQLFTTVAWNASPSPEVTGYAVYYQVVNLPVTNRADAGEALSVTIPLLVGAAHSIYAVAYNADGIESEPSNVLHYTPPPMTPMRLFRQSDGSVQLRFRTSPLSLCRVEWTPTLDPPVWQTLGLSLLASDEQGNVVVSDPGAIKSPSRFYRAAKY